MVVDAVASVVAMVAAGVASAEHAGGVDVLAPIGVAGGLAASSAYGFVQIHRCRAEHDRRPDWSLADMPAVM